MEQMKFLTNMDVGIEGGGSVAGESDLNNKISKTDANIKYFNNNNGLKKTITVAGDINTYYPVYIKFENNDMQLVSRLAITKKLYTKTPAYPGNHSSGTSSLNAQYDCYAFGWDGNGTYINTLTSIQTYAKLLSHIDNQTQEGGVIAYLRGGGCEYKIYSDTPFSIVGIYYAETTLPETFVVKPRTTLGNVGFLFKTSAMLQAIYPVGSIYMSMVNTSPASIIGGTWEPIAAGRVLVGVNTGDTDFNAANKSGGSKTITVAQSNLPPRTMVRVSLSGQGGAQPPFGAVTGWANTTMQDANLKNSQPIKTVPPYLTCYMWKRTS